MNAAFFKPGQRGFFISTAEGQEVSFYRGIACQRTVILQQG